MIDSLFNPYVLGLCVKTNSFLDRRTSPTIGDGPGRTARAGLGTTIWMIFELSGGLKSARFAGGRANGCATVG